MYLFLHGRSWKSYFNYLCCLIVTDCIDMAGLVCPLFEGLDSGELAVGKLFAMSDLKFTVVSLSFSGSLPHLGELQISLFSCTSCTLIFWMTSCRSFRFSGEVE